MSNHALNPAEAAVALHAASLPRRWLRSFDRGLIALVEVCAAALLAVEIVVLLAGVICRYALHQRWCGRTNLPGFCSCGSPCWAPYLRCGAVNICG